MAKLTKNPLKNKIVGLYLAPGEQGANWPARPLAPAVVAGADAFFPFVSGVLGPAGADVLDPDGAAFPDVAGPVDAALPDVVDPAGVAFPGAAYLAAADADGAACLDAAFPDVAGPVDAVFPDVVDPGGVVLAAAFDGAAGPLGVVLAVALLDVVEPHGAVVHAAYLDDAALAGAADQECAADQKCAALVVGPDSVGPSVLDQDALHRGVWHQGTWHRGVWGRAVFVRAVPVLYGAVRDGLFPAPTACAGLLPASSVPFPFFPRPGVHAPAANVRFAQPVVRAPAYAPVHGYSDPTALACKRHNRCNSGRYDNKASENKDLECNPTLKPVLPTKIRQL